jgi:hypothetical protein
MITHDLHVKLVEKKVKVPKEYLDNTNVFLAPLPVSNQVLSSTQTTRDKILRIINFTPLTTTTASSTPGAETLRFIKDLKAFLSCFLFSVA